MRCSPPSTKRTRIRRLGSIAPTKRNGTAISGSRWVPTSRWEPCSAARPCGSSFTTRFTIAASSPSTRAWRAPRYLRSTVRPRTSPGVDAGTHGRLLSSDRPRRTPAWRRLPPDIWALGFGSLFMDSSSELIHSLLPVFLVSTLGATVVTVGFLEGVAEATAAILKVFSGALSDYFGKRKPLMIFGYGLAACTKPIFPLARSVGWVFGARFVDRVGKGIRGAPRDALVADIMPPESRGAAYGLRQGLDSVGAWVGPLLAVLFMGWFAGDMRK